MSMDRVEELCRKFTDLNDDEIMNIRMMANMLQPLANLEDADIFVDCPCKDGDAIVVAEAKPSGVPSAYQNSVVGMFAKYENEPAVSRTLCLGISTKHMKALTQESTHVVQSVEPINFGERTIGALIREKRLDEKYVASKRLHLSRKNFEKMADAISNIGDENSWLTEYIEEGLLLISKEGRVTFRNTVAKELYKNLGYVEDVLGQVYENICLVRTEIKGHKNMYAFAETTVGKHTLCIRHVKLDKEDTYLAVVIRDITWMKEQEKELILKSVAIKEMHHRVKNNLQTIASLLRLQSRHCDSEETRRVLAETLERILAISATHQLLAQNGVDQVKIGEVLMTIRNNTLRYYATPGFDIDFEIEGDDFEVDSDVSTSVALVVNELLQNSLKYAFIDRDEGRVKIIVTKGVLYSSIRIIDDGSGFDVERVDENGLGLNIVKALIKDRLRGSLDIKSSEEGTCVSFQFINQTIDITNVT
ncbi:sensor histidine kinase [Anaerocolumna cellulosilytica]|uniref:histidine kinase n=2 Tax=Anaerocolumna cellulosilytica TaxID=433286 RepID=A0A6S6QUN7_9FIRM|nr:sensor histidine kinase [Anaerocolumna cellulosilytica]